ncbi:MAG: hypothetical protein ABIJ09_19615 [Pseudomonadota bacterium]
MTNVADASLEVLDMPASRATVRPHDPPAADRLLVVLSDVEMGAGGHQDDFPHSDWLGELILSYNQPPYTELPVELVLNGDIFDLLKTSYLDAYPRHISPDVTLGKMSRIAAAHPRFFEAMRAFLGHTGAERRAVFVTGNHDAELVFPELQLLVRSLCGHADQIQFAGFRHVVGSVHIEHGSQLDPLFAVEEDRPIVDFEGQRLLNISWGAGALLDTVMMWQPIFGFHERLLPRDQVFELLPEFKELLTGTFWRYWTRDYWKGYFGSKDPTRKLGWSMAKELASRFGSKSINVHLGSALVQKLREGDDIRLVVLGHKHEAGWWTYGDRKLLQAGCFRNEFMMSEGGKNLRPCPKTYVEVYIQDGHPVHSQLVEVQGPPAPEGYVPVSIFDVLPRVQELLAAQQIQSEDKKAWRAQEKKEKAEASS